MQPLMPLPLPPPPRPRLTGTVTFHVVTALALALALTGEPLALALPSQARRISDSRLGITAEAPPGWTIARRTGFAETIFLLTFPDGSRISLSAEETAIRSTGELVEQNRQGLSRQGFVVVHSASGPGDWSSLDVDVPSRGEKLRQLYQLRLMANKKNQALVLTLVSATKNFSFHDDALSFVVERMTLEDPPSPPSTTAPAKNNGHPGDARPADASAANPELNGDTAHATPRP
jgi:hypothetical protein